VSIRVHPWLKVFSFPPFRPFAYFACLAGKNQSFSFFAFLAIFCGQRLRSGLRIPPTSAFSLQPLALSLAACLFLLLFSAPASAQERVQTLSLSSRFNDPTGVVMDRTGNLFIADSQNHVIRQLTPAGTLTTLAGAAGTAGTNDGPAALARFDTPSGIALGPDGSLYVTDTGNHTIRRLAISGDDTVTVSTLAGSPGLSGSTNGPALDARFNSPLGLAWNTNTGVLYIADTGNHAIRKLAFASAFGPGEGTVSTLAGEVEIWGSSDGLGDAAHFNGPVGLAVDGQGNLFVADAYNHTIRRVTPQGLVTTWAGLAGVDGCVDATGSAARFCQPAELALGRNGVLYVADSLNHVIRRIDPDRAVTTLAGLPGQDGAVDGPSLSARFFNPYGLTIDPAGNLYITDTYNQALRLLLVPFRVVLSGSGIGSARQIVWDSVFGKKYRVQYKDQLSATTWQDLGALVTATGPTVSVEDSTASPAQRYYRVVLVE
jgi:sugar lactone lactonase YvrE